VYRWRISIFGKTPARPLGIVVAPDEAAARTKAIDFYEIEPSQQFRVVAVKVVRAKAPARTKEGVKS